MADGHLIFDTKLDQKGFVKGIKNITSGITALAGTIKALTDRAIASFNKITAAYVTQIEAEARLSATMRNSTAATKEQIQSVKDLASSLQEVGVVGDEVQLAGAQKLATYVSSVESVKKILPVLDDMIAQQYGFSASTDSAVTIATMLGKVLQGQTSALSRYGYKLDEVQEKLLKYGTEEQRVATLAAVVEESVSGVNKALANTPTGKVKQLSNDFGDLKETVGKMLTDVLYPVISALDVLIKKLNAIFSTASNKIRELMGITDSTDLSLGQSFDGMEDVTEETAQNVADMADSAEQAEKANKGNLADFDELNVLSQPESTDNSTAQQLAEETTQAELLADQIAETENGIDDLSDAVAGVDFSFIQEKIQAVIEFISPLVEKVKGFFGSIKDSVLSWWDNGGGEAFDKFKNTLLSIKSVIVDIWNSYISPFLSYIGESLSQLWSEHIKPLWDGVLEVISALWEAVSAVWDNFLEPLYETFVKRIMVGVMGVLMSLWDLIVDLFKVIAGIVKNVLRIIKGVLEFITGIFTGDLNKAFDGIKDIFSGFVGVIWTIFKGAINVMVDALNTVWSAVYGVIKSIVDGIGDFVSAIGDVLGHSWGFSLPNEVPRLPRLATGTVVPANYGEFTAVLGDNKRDPEIVSPIPAMKQAFLEALAESGITGGRTDSGDIIVQIDGREVFRAVKRENDAQKRRHGGVSQLA